MIPAADQGPSFGAAKVELRAVSLLSWFDVLDGPASRPERLAATANRARQGKGMLGRGMRTSVPGRSGKIEIISLPEFESYAYGERVPVDARRRSDVLHVGLQADSRCQQRSVEELRHRFSIRAALK
jgi:hypothetical protein